MGGRGGGRGCRAPRHLTCVTLGDIVQVIYPLSVPISSFVKWNGDTTWAVVQTNATYVKHLKQYLASSEFYRNVSQRWKVGRAKGANGTGVENGSIKKKANTHSPLPCARYIRLILFYPYYLSFYTKV